jgi:alpha-beta hydrolase superfamily lysophospholipase
MGKMFPKQALPEKLNRVYGMTIHASQQGSFDYDLEKKPLDGFPFYGGWIDMILSAQEQVASGLGLQLPVLSLHSDRSRKPGKAPTPEDFRADCVLRVEDIARLSPRLGSRVTDEAIPGGLHDLVLSAPEVRTMAIGRMVDFLRRAC